MQELERQFKANGGTFEEYRIEDLFVVQNNPQLDKDHFVFSENANYPYFTRTENNNGILGYVEYLDEKHLVKGNSLAIGMISMRFHYISHSFYAGQFTKTAFPKFDCFNETIALYFISLLGKFQKMYQDVLVRDFEQKFYDSFITLPTLDGGIAFDYMESVIRELENERIIKVNAYLKSSGLENTELTQEEKDAVLKLRNGDVEWKEFKVCGKYGIFNVNNTHSILQSQIVSNSGEYPYVTASENNNSVSTYVNYDIEQIEEGNSIMIGGKTLVITYQESDYFSNDSHNLACYVKDEKGKSKEIQLFLVSALYKNLKPKYSWGDSISGKKIQSDTFFLPVTAEGKIDWDFMQNLITAESRLAIRGVVEWKASIESEMKSHLLLN